MKIIKTLEHRVIKLETEKVSMTETIDRTDNMKLIGEKFEELEKIRKMSQIILATSKVGQQLQVKILGNQQHIYYYYYLRNSS